MAAAPALIDVALAHRAAVGGRLDRVGMTEIELPVRLATPDGVASRAPARVDVFVSLDDASAKGIHMSRLFLLAQETLEKELLSLTKLETRLLGHAVVVEHQEGLHAHNAVSRVAGGTLRASH